jgi:alpha-N-acetylglucosaminidase
MILGFRPNLKPWSEPPYPASVLVDTLELMLMSGELRNNNGYKYDLVDITTQALNDYAISVHSKLSAAFDKRDQTEVIKQMNLIKSIIVDLDMLLVSDQNFLLGTWLNTAKTWSDIASEKQLIEKNARLQVTSWGPANSPLSQYAYKMWSGLVGDFYKQRWDIFFDEVIKALQQQRQFDEAGYLKRAIQWEADWVLQTKGYPDQPSGDTYSIVLILFKKYFA